ncbi:hypothetical protein BEH94_10745 [Candidatus Altiarchaeales archaeon WOR_SM1_SCG]|nr:hypothetical protein BEH94_10745 [Candidatus Altiarchaeales archaeon WOR_SM1_SCG]
MQKMKTKIKNKKGNINQKESNESKKLIKNLNKTAAKGLIILLIFSFCIGTANASEFNSGVSVNIEKTIELNDFCTKLNYELKEQSDERIAFQFSTGDWGYVYSNGVVKVGSMKVFSLAQKDVLERELIQIAKLDENSISALREEQVKDSAVYYMQQAGMFKKIRFEKYNKGCEYIKLKLVLPDCSVRDGRINFECPSCIFAPLYIDGVEVFDKEESSRGVKYITRHLTPGTHNLYIDVYFGHPDITLYIEAYTTPTKKPMTLYSETDPNIWIDSSPSKSINDFGEHPPTPSRSCFVHSDCDSDGFCGSDKICRDKKKEDNSCSENEECLSSNCVDEICRPRGYCTSDESCDPSKYCSDHKCLAKKQLDESCSSDNECSTNYCKDNKCQRITLLVKVDENKIEDIEKIRMFIPPGYSGYKKLTLSTDKGELNNVEIHVTGEVADWFQEVEPFGVSTSELNKYLYLEVPSDISAYRSYHGILNINGVEKPVEVEVPNIDTNLQCDRAYFDKNRKIAHCSAAVTNLGDEIKNVHVSLRITNGGAIANCRGIEDSNIGIAMRDKPVLKRYDKILLDCNIELTDPNIEHLGYTLQMTAENSKVGESFTGEKSGKIYVKELPVVEEPGEPDDSKEIPPEQPTGDNGKYLYIIIGVLVVIIIIITIIAFKRK